MILACLTLALGAAPPSPAGMALLPAGTHQPFFRESPTPRAEGAGSGSDAGVPASVKVPAFLLDVRPVTSAEFLAFVTDNPRWRRSRVPRLFADTGYLQGWSGDLALPSTAVGAAPVTRISWFAAPAGQTPKNGFGVQDLAGVGWEWTLDFNGTMTFDESRGAAEAGAQFCGSGGAQATDPSDTATFLRYAFRSSLKASYTTRDLGFRCATEVRG